MTTDALTIINALVGIAGAGALAVGGFIANRVATRLDRLSEDVGELKSQITGVQCTFEARWESLMNDQPSPSGRLPLRRGGGR